MIMIDSGIKIPATMYGLFEYPGDDYLRNAEACRENFDSSESEAASHYKKFLDHANKLSKEELEEWYTRTFDLNPVCALDIGWHLFGEDYKRGVFLARIRRELQAAGIDESIELPDHLPHVLKLLVAMPEDEAVKFGNSCIIPALGKMLEGFKGKENPYGDLIKCVHTLVRNQIGDTTEETANG